MSKRSSLINPFGFGSSLKHSEKQKDKSGTQQNNANSNNNSKPFHTKTRRESLRISSNKQLTVNIPDVDSSTPSLPNHLKKSYNSIRPDSSSEVGDSKKARSHTPKSLIPDDIKESTPEHVPGKIYNLNKVNTSKTSTTKNEIQQQQIPLEKASTPSPPPPQELSNEHSPIDLERNPSTTSSYYGPLGSTSRNTRSTSIASSYYGTNDYSQVPNRSASIASSFYPAIGGAAGLTSVAGTIKSTRTVYENPYSDGIHTTTNPDLSSRRRRPPPGMLENLPPLPPMEISRYKDGNIYVTNPRSPISPQRSRPADFSKDTHPSPTVSTLAVNEQPISSSITTTVNPPVIHPTAKKLPQIPVNTTISLTTSKDLKVNNISNLNNEKSKTEPTSDILITSKDHSLSIHKRLSNDDFNTSIISNNTLVDNISNELPMKLSSERPDIMRRVVRGVSQSDSSSSKKSATPEVLGNPMKLTESPFRNSPKFSDIEKIVQDDEVPQIGHISTDDVTFGSSKHVLNENSLSGTPTKSRRSKFLISLSPESLPKHPSVLVSSPLPRPSSSPKQQITQSPKFTDLHKLTGGANPSLSTPAHNIPALNLIGTQLPDSSNRRSIHSIDDISLRDFSATNTPSVTRKLVGTPTFSHDSLHVQPQLSNSVFSNSTGSSIDQPYYDVRQDIDEEDEDDWWNPDKDDEIHAPGLAALNEEHLANDTTVIKSSELGELSSHSWIEDESTENYEINKLGTESSGWNSSKDTPSHPDTNKRCSLLDDEFGENELTSPKSPFNGNRESDNLFEINNANEEEFTEFARDDRMKELYGDSSEDEDLGIDTSNNDPNLPSFHSDADYYIRSSNTRLSIANPESPGKSTLADEQSWLDTPTSPVKSFGVLNVNTLNSPISIHDDRKLVIANKSSSETTSNNEFDDSESKSSGLNFSVHHYNHFDVDDEDDDRHHKMVIVNGNAASLSKDIDDEMNFLGVTNYDTSPHSTQKIPSIVTSSNTPPPPTHQKQIPKYDRREELTVAPLTHSSIVPTAMAPGSTVHSRRPPPDFPTGGRNSRSVSMSTSQPDMFDILVKVPGPGGSSNTVPTVTGLGISASVPAPQALDSAINLSPNFSPELSNSLINEKYNNESVESKGVKSDYIQKLRSRGKVCVIDEAVPDKLLPISIKSTAKSNRQGNARRHARTQSHQSTPSFSGSLKHGSLKPKTRMLASEIDASELPDSKLSHSLGKTKIPTNPDAEIIAVTDQLRKLTERPTKDSLDGREGANSPSGLNRYASVRSARGFAGGRESGNFKLYIANPDSDSD